MTTQRLISTGAGLAVAGGVAWLAKLAVLAATDGAESPAVATLYFSGLVLLAIGSIGIALRLVERRTLWLRVAIAAAAPFGFVAMFLLLDGLLVPLTESRVPHWAEAEAGVLSAALIWLIAGGLTLRREPSLRTSRA